MKADCIISALRSSIKTVIADLISLVSEDITTFSKLKYGCVSSDSHNLKEGSFVNSPAVLDASKELNV